MDMFWLLCAIVLALCEGRTGLAISGVFEAGKTRSAAAEYHPVPLGLVDFFNSNIHLPQGAILIETIMKTLQLNQP